ncbi:helix-turn-helix domain-containing protein [Paenibacillus hamazuiensis]|uniref:helix-turn-helix domain-containing protein n=1 Tax=Paenibacillus hamazuiensis TaxID=2936508 RepID=UPI00200C598E|nr:AraC family transcriptional regulator [Paenibacillus hamazuiensis]
MWNPSKSQTLFVKMFISFMAIIVLFAVFHIFTFRFFNEGMQNEIVQYNRLILKNTAERYQNHFTRLKTLLFTIYNDENVVAFNRQLSLKPADEINYWQANDALKMVRTEAFNPMFFLENILIYFEKPSLVLEKEGTSEASMMFSRFYASSRYPADFWKRQISRNRNYTLHPTDVFTLSTVNETKKLGLIPFSFRMPGSHYIVIAMLDSGKLLEAFNSLSPGSRFMILQEDGSLLYRSDDGISPDRLPSFDDGKDYKLSGGFYYFSEKDSSGLTYVTAVPYGNIASKVSRLNATSYIILAVSIVIGVAASLLFSRRINRPFKEIVASILQRNPTNLQSTIKEFDLINREMRELMREKEEVHSELLTKKSLLTSFSYINKLKSINSDLSDWKDVLISDQPFVLVLYQLHFRAALLADTLIKPEKAAYYIREYISVLMTERFPSSHTFQIENNQILTFVTTGETEGSIEEVLGKLKKILDRDSRYVLVTIAVSPVFGRSSEINEAYRLVQDMARQGKLCEETQFITEYKPARAYFFFTPMQEQELYAHVQAGNEAACVQMIDRMLDHMFKHEAGLLQYRHLAESIIARTGKIAESAGMDGEMYARMTMEMQSCLSLEEFKRFYRGLFAYSTALIRAKKEETDPAIDFIMNYIETRYAEDFSLDMLAEKLGMSATYLSMYIKEKTGANFSDHINRVRIREAKRMLASVELSIQHIGERIGYRNVTSFNRMFKKFTGMAPGEYRKSLLEPAQSDF